MYTPSVGMMPFGMMDGRTMAYCGWMRAAQDWESRGANDWQWMREADTMIKTYLNVFFL